MKRVCVVVSLLAALLFLPAGRAEEPTPLPALYVRDFANPESVLGQVRNLAIRRGADRILVVFDTVTFAPPPGRTEFSESHDFPSDLPAWLDALAAFRPPGGESRYAGEGMLRVATTLSPRPLAVADAGWRQKLLDTLDSAWWDLKTLRSFEPATTWIARFLARVGGNRCMLVLVTGDVLPERWADHSHRNYQPEPWRRKLLERGEYWSEEAVARAVRASDATLDIVAPEARFGDFLPYTDIPELPWAARPMILMPRNGMSLPTLEEMIESLRPHYPDLSEEELRAAAERALKTAAEMAAERSHAVRFQSWTPVWFPQYGSFTFFNTDCPSRFGYWPFARAAAATGGSYLFYPFPPSEFLDECPYDRELLRKLAPEYGTRAEFLAARRNDPALKALCRASSLVIEETPWSDGTEWFGGGGRSTGWFAFASPSRLEKRYRERNKPFDTLAFRKAGLAAWKRYGRDLEGLLRKYDEAIRILEEAEASIARGEGALPHRRSLANLRLGRFWFEMSAFHLHALSLYLLELEKHVPADFERTGGDLCLTHVPTIRMSDCLSGYSGLSISVEEDRRLQALPGEDHSHYRNSQRNILPLPFGSSQYRALRHPGEVLKKLDPRLVPRALRMIEAGVSVMRHEGRSPFGWMVYYSEAATFVYYALPADTVPQERPGVDPAPGATTPRPRPRAGGPTSGN